MKYGKHMAVRQTSRFMAHDEDQICEPGDIVEIRCLLLLTLPSLLYTQRYYAKPRLSKPC